MPVLSLLLPSQLRTDSVKSTLRTSLRLNTVDQAQISEKVKEPLTAISKLLPQTSLYQPFHSQSAHVFSTNSQAWVPLSHRDSNRESSNPQSWPFNRSPTLHSLKSAEATAVSALNQLTLPSLQRQRTGPSPSTVLFQSSKPLSSARRTWLLNNPSVRLRRIPSVSSTTRTVVLVATPTVPNSPCAFPTSPTVIADSDQPVWDNDWIEQLYFERTTSTAYLA